MIFSRSGSCYASTAKLLNFLIASLLMFTVAFAAIPYFLVSQSKGKIATRSTKAKMNRAKILNAKKYGDSGIIYGAKAYTYRTSSTKGKAIVSKYGRAGKVLTVNSRSYASPPANFEARTKKDEKVQTP
jgi:hypothetical protein